MSLTVFRGRPKAIKIPDLMEQGKSSSGPNQCPVCFRVFRRLKNLKEHQKTHTGERPYICSYPGCHRNFVQSGHLKLHVYRHTGEKPFACPVLGCPQRFPHANRKCPSHPGKHLKRDFCEWVCVPEGASKEELNWFEQYTKDKENCNTPSLKKLHGKKRRISDSSESSDDVSSSKENNSLKNHPSEELKSTVSSCDTSSESLQECDDDVKKAAEILMWMKKRRHC